MHLPDTFEELVENAEGLNLYQKLIIQLNKDLSLANLDLEINEETPPLSLKLILQDFILNLYQSAFPNYLNLLYIVDVNEIKVRAIPTEDAFQISEAITFLILQREWQKVWYRNKYS